jgi:hypothetical protein
VVAVEVLTQVQPQVLVATVAVLWVVSVGLQRQVVRNQQAVAAEVLDSTQLETALAVLAEQAWCCCHMQCRVKNFRLTKRADPRCFSIKCPLDLHRVLQTSLHLPTSPHLMR